MTQRYNCVIAMIPPFNAAGNLPPGIHTAEWAEFSARFGTSSRRKELLVGLGSALEALYVAGCKIVYIDGSFVTTKVDPGDFDACWDITDVDPQLLDPVLLTFDDGRAAQKARYGGELFPAQLPEGMSGKTFLEFFQRDRRTGEPKGIVAIDAKAFGKSLSLRQRVRLTWIRFLGKVLGRFTTKSGL